MQSNVTIIGVGLIGGSLAKAFKHSFGDDINIINYDDNQRQLELAKNLGVLDVAAEDLEEALAEANYVFLCTPVRAMTQLLEQVLTSNQIKPETIVTDVGSTKLEINQRVSGLGEVVKCHFIGGHPMAGSHKSGVEAAQEHLFEQKNSATFLFKITDLVEVRR